MGFIHATMIVPYFKQNENLSRGDSTMSSDGGNISSHTAAVL